MSRPYVVCSKPKCANPVPVGRDDRSCEKHGGETLPIWGIYHKDHGWLVDMGVGGTYSFDMDDAAWHLTSREAVDSLIASDLLEANVADHHTLRVHHAGPFLVVRIK